jgi:hypothetical protein
MHKATQTAFFDELEKISVSKEWIAKRVASGLSKAKDPLKRVSKMQHRLGKLDTGAAEKAHVPFEDFMKRFESREGAMQAAWKHPLVASKPSKK